MAGDADEVLEGLRRARRKLTPEQIVEATGLAVTVVDASLQALLLRRLVVCDSYDRPGRGGQSARWIGSSKDPLWSASYEKED